MLQGFTRRLRGREESLAAVVGASLILFITALGAPVGSGSGNHGVGAPLSPPQAKVLGDKTPRSEPNCAHAKCFALTFDDGPNSFSTPRILGVLEHYHVPATFFVIGKHVIGRENLLARMARDGDEIGNHTWSHPDLTTLSKAQIEEQVYLTQLVVVHAGAPSPTLLRPPYGAVNKKVIADVPLPLAMWNEDPRDWQAKTAKQVVKNFEASARPGGVADMHDIYDTTADALPRIIKYLHKRHYQLVTFTQLLHPPAGAHGEFFGFKPSDFAPSHE